MLEFQYKTNSKYELETGVEMELKEAIINRKSIREYEGKSALQNLNHGLLFQSNRLL